MREGWLFPLYDAIHSWMLESRGETTD